jgi:hypothetical protein
MRVRRGSGLWHRAMLVYHKAAVADYGLVLSLAHEAEARRVKRLNLKARRHARYVASAVGEYRGLKISELHRPL